MTKQTDLNSDPTPNNYYHVEGLEHPDPDANYAADGQHPPFRIFMPGPQQYLPGKFRDRLLAEGIAAALNASTKW